VSIEEVDDLVEGIRSIDIRKRQRLQQHQTIRMRVFDMPANRTSSVGYTDNEEFWEQWNASTDSEMVLPTLFRYFEFRRTMDPQYDAEGWAGMAEHIFVDLGEESTQMEAVVNFVGDYELTDDDWDFMILNVKNWHIEYYRRLGVNNGQKCLQGIGLQYALLFMIEEARNLIE